MISALIMARLAKLIDQPPVIQPLFDAALGELYAKGGYFAVRAREIKNALAQTRSPEEYLTVVKNLEEEVQWVNMVVDKSNLDMTGWGYH